MGLPASHASRSGRGLVRRHGTEPGDRLLWPGQLRRIRATRHLGGGMIRHTSSGHESGKPKPFLRRAAPGILSGVRLDAGREYKAPRS